MFFRLFSTPLQLIQKNVLQHHHGREMRRFSNRNALDKNIFILKFTF
jgi:hypothetical protein